MIMNLTAARTVGALASELNRLGLFRNIIPIKIRDAVTEITRNPPIGGAWRNAVGSIEISCPLNFGLLTHSPNF